MDFVSILRMIKGENRGVVVWKPAFKTAKPGFF